MFALLSDIHANLEALTAVLADIDRHGVERIFCLGDIVGYGPDPVACIDIIRERCEVVLLGHFDQAAIGDREGFGETARRSLDWFCQLDGYERHLPFLAYRPRFHQEGGILYVHGSARNPTHEYVFPEDIYNSRKMERIFALVDHTCFCGHTHIPGVFVQQIPDDLYHFHSPDEIENTFYFDHRKTIINVGSVGQPRDGDPRAGYILVEGELVRFRRVEYDSGTTIRKIRDIPDLDDFLGDRLRDGR